MATASSQAGVITASNYDAVFRHVLDSIYRICLAVLHNPEEAKDATSAVIEKLVTKLPHTEVRDLDAWLRTVARTTAIDHLRALNRRRYTPLEEVGTVQDPSPTPEEVLLDDDLRRQLAQHLTSLTPDQQQVIQLRQERLSSKEIGDLLGRSPGWVDTTYFRALAKLRQNLSADDRGGVA